MALIKVANDPHSPEEFKVAAVSALGAFDQNRREALRALVQVLRDRQGTEQVRAAAAEALGGIGGPAEIAVADLIDAMQESKTLCQSAAKALLSIAPAARPAILTLVEALNPERAPSPREILATFRRNFLLSETKSSGSPDKAPADGIRQALEQALQNLRARQSLAVRPEPEAAVSMVS